MKHLSTTLLAGLMLVATGHQLEASSYPRAVGRASKGNGPALRPLDLRGPIIGYAHGLPLYADDPHVKRALERHARQERENGDSLDAIFLFLGEPMQGPAGSKYGASRSFLDGKLSDAELRNAEIGRLPDRPIMHDRALLQYLPAGYFRTVGGRAALERLIDNGFRYTNNEAGKRDVADRLLNFYDPVLK